MTEQGRLPWSAVVGGQRAQRRVFELARRSCEVQASPTGFQRLDICGNKEGRLPVAIVRNFVEISPEFESLIFGELKSSGRSDGGPGPGRRRRLEQADTFFFKRAGSEREKESGRFAWNRGSSGGGGRKGVVVKARKGF